MVTIIGWDVGGAHVKAARVENGVVREVVQILCPLWKGLEQLDRALESARKLIGSSDVNVITMTGELSDIFPSRAEGVVQLSEILASLMGRENTKFYAGPAGFVDASSARRCVHEIASANWHASASYVAKKIPRALFVDMGSTTTDLITVMGGQCMNNGYTDADRLTSGELVYTGFTRSFLMSICQKAPFAGQWTALMNEHFATTSDIYRILGQLDEAVDQHQTADNREKSISASVQRLSRMIGRDASDLTELQARDLALWFAESQLRMLVDAAALSRSRFGEAQEGPIVGAGIGLPVVRRLSSALGVQFVQFGDLVVCEEQHKQWASACAPAAAVAMLMDGSRAG